MLVARQRSEAAERFRRGVRVRVIVLFTEGDPLVLDSGARLAPVEVAYETYGAPDAAASNVVVVHRRDEFRASKIMLERARGIENIEWLTPYAVDEFSAGENGGLEVARLRNTENGEEREVEIAGAFIAIGHEPQSQLVEGQLELDDEGYVITEGRSTRTGKPGVFAAGDVVDHTYRQAVTAAGSGTQAALDAEWYLRDTPGIPVPEGMPAGDPAEAQWAPLREP
ncbi:MAG: FAD-dependent oxidoreductase [Actinobacteria bacterium]|nr:FAD-dependent oxidoreductase [Actinomycetota bacterium]